MQISLGQQYNVGEKPTVILYIYINRHVRTPEKHLYPVMREKQMPKRLGVVDVSNTQRI